MSDRKQELREEAKSLGIEIKGNPGEDTLQKMIDEFYEAESKSSGAVIVEDKEEVEVSSDGSTISSESPMDMHRRVMAERKKALMKTRVVRVNLTDKRENSELSSYYIHSGSFGKHIPLDTPIELEEALIRQLRRLQVPMHVERGDGTKVTRMMKKFIVEVIKDIE